MPHWLLLARIRGLLATSINPQEMESLDFPNGRKRRGITSRQSVWTAAFGTRRATRNLSRTSGVVRGMRILWLQTFSSASITTVVAELERKLGMTHQMVIQLRVND